MIKILSLFSIVLPLAVWAQTDTASLLDAEHLKAIQDEINSYSLSAEVGYKHDKSNAKEYIERSGSLGADYNLYPFEFNAHFGFKNTLKDNETQQNLNKLDISLDRYLRHVHNHEKEDLKMVFRPEMFLFFQRSTNEYLAINQKYETGAGFTLNLFSTAKVDDDHRLNELQRLYASATGEQKSKIDNLYSSHLAKYRKFRVALLMGVLSQTEELEYTVNVPLAGGDSAATVSFDPVQEYKWEVRPTITYRPTKTVKIDARAYVKIPFADVEKQVNGGEAIDYYIEAPVKFQYTPGVLRFTVKYTWYYENAPAFEVLQTSAGDKTIVLPHEYSSLDFSVGIGF